MLAFNANAHTAANDLCSKLPGHWQGFYTIKDQNTCTLLNGCTHLVMADATYLSDNTYQINLTPAVGHGGTVNITCENGVISSPVNEGNTITASCDAMNHCFVVYDDPKIQSEMAKV